MASAHTGGQALRSFRARAGLSQEAVAHRAGISPRTMRDLEAGRSRPRPATLRALVEALGLTRSEQDALLAEPVAAQVVPRQLPAAPRLFAARQSELATLDELLTEDAARCVLSGPGGVGKTWLGLHWAHRNAARFTDGQLYVNLRGFSPTAEPLPTPAALRALLEGLGVSAPQIPESLDGRAALFRSLVADKRLLLFLDNARDAAQVMDLLPSGPGTLALVTSRDRLLGMSAAAGVTHVHLSTWDEASSRAMLSAQLDDARIAAEPEVLDALVAGCGGLPLALGILAARAAGQPHIPLRALAEDIIDETARLDILDTADLTTSLRAVLDSSLRALDETAAWCFGYFGLLPSIGAAPEALASALDLPVPQARVVLGRLESAGLLSREPDGRHRMHDLTHLYATELAALLDDDALAPAARRLLDHYIHTGYRAASTHHAMAPGVDGPPAPGCVLTPIPDESAAIGWFLHEEAALVALQDTALRFRWWESVAALAGPIRQFHSREWGDPRQASRCFRNMVTAAEHLSPAELLTARRHLGLQLLRGGSVPEGMRELESVLEAATVADEPAQQAETRFALTFAHHAQGEFDDSLRYVLRALEAFEELGDEHRVASCHNLAAWLYSCLGDHRRARTHGERSRAMAARLGDRSLLADALDTLGVAAHRDGELARAREYFEEALGVFDEMVSTRWRADTLRNLGDTLSALGEEPAAREAWEKAYTQYRLSGSDSEADAVADRIDAITA